jgi:hypothetical protein
MQYEENCQLGFNNSNAFDDLYYGKDEYSYEDERLTGNLN